MAGAVKDSLENAGFVLSKAGYKVGQRFSMEYEMYIKWSNYDRHSQISLDGAGNVTRSKEEIDQDSEEEDDFGYTKSKS